MEQGICPIATLYLLHINTHRLKFVTATGCLQQTSQP